jgi:hypothetical protein
MPQPNNDRRIRFRADRELHEGLAAYAARCGVTKNMAAAMLARHALGLKVELPKKTFSPDGGS